jgi:uncharacterized membrane protein YhaH (DUF805 family)
MLADRLRLWFGFDAPVDRRTYFLNGLALMACKYALDVAVVRAFTGRLFTPRDYLNPVWTMRQEALRGVPTWAVLALALWTLPFLWVGVSMSMRRALDTGRSAWLALLFFVPVVNYALMALLSVLPAKSRVPLTLPPPSGPWRSERVSPVLDDRLKSGLLGVAAALAVAIPTVLFSVYVKQSYSVGLFLGTPFTVGSISAHVFNYRHPRTAGQTHEVVLISLMLAAGVLLLFAAEGAFCLALALPLAIPVGIVGGIFGRAIALRSAEPPGRTGLAALVAPLLVLVEPHIAPAVHEVVTVVEVAAPADVVWRRVVSFPDLPPPTEWVFRIGVAAPLRARIVGAGVGAMRYCDFTTGSFVEPVTAWQPNGLLAFDITAQAPPMREWSPYRDVNPPHLDGYFRATHGEFLLTPLPGGRTRLEGRTTYTVDMFPQSYWTLPAGRIVAAIHQRVLRHIKSLAENGER